MGYYNDCMSFHGAASVFSTARYPDRGKPLCNNTRLYQRAEWTERTTGGPAQVSYAVELHCTDVVTINCDGTYTLNTGGWNTHTTWNRIYRFSPLNWGKMEYIEGAKHIALPPRDDDPNPGYPHREIPKPFHADDPGPAPEKSSAGCLAGEVIDSPSKYEWQSDRLEYGEGSYANANARVEQGARYEQCPHCAEFNRGYEKWRYAMHGQSWRRTDPYRGYETYCEMMDLYGSREEWRDAWREEGREVSAGQREYRRWRVRNYIEYFDGIRIDGDSYVVDTDGALRKAAIAAYERHLEDLLLAKEARIAEQWDEKILPFMQSEAPNVYHANGQPIAAIFPRTSEAYAPSLVLVKGRCSHKAKEEIMLRAAETGNRIDIVKTAILEEAISYIKNE